jgi:hypothetical protein
MKIYDEMEGDAIARWYCRHLGIGVSMVNSNRMVRHSKARNEK